MAKEPGRNGDDPLRATEWTEFEDNAESRKARNIGQGWVYFHMWVIMWEVESPQCEQ